MLFGVKLLQSRYGEIKHREVPGSTCRTSIWWRDLMDLDDCDYVPRGGLWILLKERFRVGLIFVFGMMFG